LSLLKTRWAINTKKLTQVNAIDFLLESGELYIAELNRLLLFFYLLGVRYNY
jgi:hypothetical protein